MRYIFLMFLLVCSLWLSAAEQNAIFNGDFQLGTAGFGIWRMLRADTNPGLAFHPLKARQGMIQLDNPNGEYFQLISREFQLPPKQTARFRAEFQGPAGARLGFTVLCILPPDNRYVTHHRSVVLTGRKQAVEIPFVTSDSKIPYVLVVYPKGKTAPSGTFRFFSFQLGGTGRPVLSGALRADKSLYTLGKDGGCRIRTELFNSTSSPLAGMLTLEIADSTSGAVVAREEVRLELAPGNTVREFQFPLKKFGAFSSVVRWNGEIIPAVDALFACIGEYKGPAEINPFETYCVGVDGSYLYQAFRGETRGGYTANGVSPEDRFRLLARMGCRLIRDWGGMYLTEWRNLEPEDGVFDFRDFDRCVDMMRRNGMEILSVFGRMYENWMPGQPPFRPDWLNKKLIRIEKNPPGTNPKFVVKVPPMPVWRRYVETFVKHAGKRISMYEIMNEPNLNMSPELYMKYMIPAAEIIRKEAPHAAILGICATGDMNGKLNEFTRRCMQLGASNYLDAVSFHPYDARELNSIEPADFQIASLRKIVGETPLCNTELYYLYDWPDPNDKQAQYTYAKAYHAAWRFLVDLGEGLKTGISIVERSLWQDGLHPVYRMHYLTDMIPTDIFVAYNALARYFEGAQCIRKFRLSQDVICYIYRKDGLPIAAIWNYTGKRGVRADLSSFRIMDLFGNPLESGEKEISESPFYLTPGKLSETEFIAQLETLDLRIAHPSASRIARLVGDRLYVTLHNTAEKEQRGVLGISGGGFIAVRTVRFTLPGKSSKSFEIPVRKVKSDGSGVTLMLYTNGTTFRMPLNVIVNKVIKREFQMKNANGSIELLNEKIIVKMNVRDATDAGPAAGKAPWKTDCVELFFDTVPFLVPEQHPQSHISKQGTFRLFVTPRDKKRLSGMGAVIPEACRLETVQNTDGYSFRIEVPVKECSALGFCVKVNDARNRGDVLETVLDNIAVPHQHCCCFSIVKKTDI